MVEKVPFGKEFRKKYYSFDDDVTPVNHGSFGAVPKPVLEAYQKHVLEDQGFPDRYLKLTMFPQLLESTKVVSEVVDADVNNLVFVTNATTGINTILRSFPFEKGDKILMQSTVYGACGNTVRFVENRIGTETVVVELNYPMEDDDVVAAFEKQFKESKIKLALFDTVTSMPGVRVPFERIIELCHKYGVLSLVDGGHSIGLIDYSINKLKPDFFTSNLHKWFSTPRGCAFLYVDLKHHKFIHTFPVSHSYLDDSVELPKELEKTRLVDRFAWTGSNSFASFVSVTDAAKFRKEVCGGEELIRDYKSDLVKKASKMILDMWGTSVIQNKTDTLMTSMFNVEIPMKPELLSKMFEPSFMDAMRLEIENSMFVKYRAFIPTQIHNGKFYARFSCEVYNELSDYKYAAESLLSIIDEFMESDLYLSKSLESEKIGK